MKIDEGVSPEVTARQKYPFDQLKPPRVEYRDGKAVTIRSNFFVPRKRGSDISGSIKHYLKSHPEVKLKRREAKHKGVNGVEIWRME